MMRKTIAITIALTLLSISYSFSQSFVPTAVTISEEIVAIEGVKHYAHRVLKGQTLYSIAKAYNVPLEEIRQLNPQVRESLRDNTILIIPVKEQVPEEVVVQIVEQESSESDIQSSQNYQERDLRQYKKHTVKWYENIEEIAKKYDTSVEAIVDLNNLQTQKLSRRQVLYIPDRNYVITKRAEVDENEEKEPEEEYIEDNRADRRRRELYRYSDDRRNNIKISLIMPFNSMYGSNKDNRYLDFYSGAIIALEDMKRLGYSAELNVIDLGDYPSVYEIIRSGTLERSDLIIGPPSLEALSALISYSNNERIPLISPMDQKAEVLAENSPYFFQVPSSGDSQQANMMKRIGSGSDLSMTTIIFETGSEMSHTVQSTMQGFIDRDIPFNAFSYYLAQGRDINNNMKTSLAPGKNNIVICSESVAFISDVLRNLNLIKSQNNYIEIDLFLSPIMGFNNLELEYLHNLNTHISLNYYVDNTDPLTKEFNRRYIEYFRMAPTPYSYQGYDIFSFFIFAITEYGKSFPLHIENKEYKLRQSTMRFISQPGGGFKNNATRDIVYTNNWNIVLE